MIVSFSTKSNSFALNSAGIETPSLLFSLSIMVESEATTRALAQPMVTKVKNTKNEKKEIILRKCLFQVMAEVFISLVRESLRCFRESGYSPSRGGVRCCAYPRAAASPTCQGIPTLRITARFPFPALAPPCPGISSPAPPGCERRQTLPPDAVSSALLLLKELC